MEEQPLICAGVMLCSINVNAVDSMSGIFIGNNRQNVWSSTEKTNAGFGRSSGRGSVILGAVNVVIDPDYIDNPGKMILRSVDIESSIL